MPLPSSPSGTLLDWPAPKAKPIFISHPKSSNLLAITNSQTGSPRLSSRSVPAYSPTRAPYSPNHDNRSPESKLHARRTAQSPTPNAPPKVLTATLSARAALARWRITAVAHRLVAGVRCASRPASRTCRTCCSAANSLSWPFRVGRW